MFRILLLLCAFVLAISANNHSSSILHVSPTASPSIHAATSFGVLTSTSMPVSSTALPSNSSVAYTTSVLPNVTVSPTHMPHSMNATSAVPTTSSAVPTTAQKPTTAPPPPAPTHGVYNVPGKQNGSYCLLAELDVVIHVQYISSVVVNATTNTTKNETSMAKIHIPYPHKNPNITVEVNGLCEKKHSSLVIEWPLYKFEIRFLAFNPDKNDTNVTDWKVAEMSLFIDTKNNWHFKNPVGPQNITAVSSNIPLKGSLGSSYLCDSDIKYNVSGVTVDFTHVKLQPFDVMNSTYNGDVQECPGDTTPTPKPKDNNIVPIAVGCALAGLVLIVLIAYIIGRRKSQRGYEKV